MPSTPPMHANRWAVFRSAAVLFLAVTAAIGLVAGLVAWMQIRGDRSLLLANERNQVALEQAIIHKEFQGVIADLLLLAENPAVLALAQEDSARTRSAAAAAFLGFCRRKAVYDQVRFLDAAGRERVRVNFNGGAPTVVADPDLQDKAQRYYFIETFRLAPGQVFVSPFDLNVENDRIETPHKPTIRFGTPIADAAGSKRGIVVINYLGENLLRQMRQASVNAQGDLMLLNAQGYWLLAPDANDEWGFQLGSEPDRSFAERLPEAWSRMAAQREGQFQDSTGVYTFLSVDPMAKVDRSATNRSGERMPADAISLQQWKVVSRVGPEVLAEDARRRLRGIVGLCALAVPAAGVAAWLFARLRARHDEANRAMRANEQRFREIAETVEDVFWVASPERRNLYFVSSAFERLWGRSPADVVEDPRIWLDAIYPADREAAERAMFDRPLDAGFDVEYRVERPDGTIRWIWDRGYVVHNPDGSVLHLVGVAEDRTDLKEAMRQVLQKERLAAIGEAMTGLAHESRNALQRSQACLEMLEKRVRDRPEVADLIARIQSAQDHLHHLYEEVRGYAAPMPLTRQPVDLGGVVEAAWLHLDRQRGGKNIRWHRENGRGEWTCAVDPFAIEQALRNVLENAIAAVGDSGAIEARFQDSTLNGRPAVRITIADDGPGLDGEQRQRIFEPFFTTKVKGTGLGMAICRRIIESHGGVVAVDDPEPGGPGGARIVIELPRSAPS